MGIKFSNNASSSITHALTADATSISITPGTGDLFPSIVEGTDYFYATLAGNNGLEIVKVTKRVLDTMTVERAQDNTDALLFDIGDLFELRIVAADFEDTFAKVDSMLEEYLEENTSMVNAALASKAPTSHASANTTHGVGTEDLYGHVKLSDDASELHGVSEGVAATPLAVSKAQTAAINEAASETFTQLSSLDSTLRTFIEEKYLPLNGGTLTGRLKSTLGADGVLTSASNDGQIRICGGDGSWSQGGIGIWYGIDSTSYPGGWAQISLNPNGEGGNNALRGYYDASAQRHVLKYGSADVLTSEGCTMQGSIKFANNTAHYISVDENGDLLVGGDGSLFRIRGLNSDTNSGGFQLRAGDGTTNKYLIGYPDGGLTWGGKNIVRSVNGTSADAAGNVSDVNSSGTNWVRLTNGLQIVFVVTTASTTSFTHTFAKPFTSTPSIQAISSGKNRNAIQGGSSTGFTFADDGSGGAKTHYILAVGKWK